MPFPGPHWAWYGLVPGTAGALAALPLAVPPLFVLQPFSTALDVLFVRNFCDPCVLGFFKTRWQWNASWFAKNGVV